MKRLFLCTALFSAFYLNAMKNTSNPEVQNTQTQKQMDIWNVSDLEVQEFHKGIQLQIWNVIKNFKNLSKEEEVTVENVNTLPSDLNRLDKLLQVYNNSYMKCDKVSAELKEKVKLKSISYGPVKDFWKFVRENGVPNEEIEAIKNREREIFEKSPNKSEDDAQLILEIVNNWSHYFNNNFLGYLQFQEVTTRAISKSSSLEKTQIEYPGFSTDTIYELKAAGLNTDPGLKDLCTSYLALHALDNWKRATRSLIQALEQSKNELYERQQKLQEECLKEVVSQAKMNTMNDILKPEIQESHKEKGAKFWNAIEKFKNLSKKEITVENIKALLVEFDQLDELFSSLYNFQEIKEQFNETSAKLKEKIGSISDAPKKSFWEFVKETGVPSEEIDRVRNKEMEILKTSSNKSEDDAQLIFEIVKAWPKHFNNFFDYLQFQEVITRAVSQGSSLEEIKISYFNAETIFKLKVASDKDPGLKDLCASYLCLSTLDNLKLAADGLIRSLIPPMEKIYESPEFQEKLLKEFVPQELTDARNNILNPETLERHIEKQKEAWIILKELKETQTQGITSENITNIQDKIRQLNELLYECDMTDIINKPNKIKEIEERLKKLRDKSFSSKNFWKIFQGKGILDERSNEILDPAKAEEEELFNKYLALFKQNSSIRQEWEKNKCDDITYEKLTEDSSALYLLKEVTSKDDKAKMDFERMLEEERQLILKIAAKVDWSQSSNIDFLDYLKFQCAVGEAINTGFFLNTISCSYFSDMSSLQLNGFVDRLYWSSLIFEDFQSWKDNIGAYLNNLVQKIRKSDIVQGKSQEEIYQSSRSVTKEEETAINAFLGMLQGVPNLEMRIIDAESLINFYKGKDQDKDHLKEYDRLLDLMKTSDEIDAEIDALLNDNSLEFMGDPDQTKKQMESTFKEAAKNPVYRKQILALKAGILRNLSFLDIISGRANTKMQFEMSDKKAGLAELEKGKIYVSFSLNFMERIVGEDGECAEQDPGKERVLMHESGHVMTGGMASITEANTDILKNIIYQCYTEPAQNNSDAIQKYKLPSKLQESFIETYGKLEDILDPSEKREKLFKFLVWEEVSDPIEILQIHGLMVYQHEGKNILYINKLSDAAAATAVGQAPRIDHMGRLLDQDGKEVAFEAEAEAKELETLIGTRFKKSISDALTAIYKTND